MSTPRVVERPPATLPLLVKAALPAVPGVNRLPGVRRRGDALPDLALVRHDVPVDRAHLAAYAEVCGFPVRDVLPATYPHVLAFGLHLALMTDPAFPFPAIGTVHLENRLTQHRPVAATERLQVTVRAGGLRAHPRGRVFDLETTVHCAAERVWEETSTFLRLGRGQAGAPSGDVDVADPPAGTGARWRLPGDLGRRYAAVSGDHNPIHLFGLSAKAFGFPRQIAHGMWTKARCLAALEGRLPDAFTASVAFRKPVLLPGTVGFGSRAEDDGWTLALTRPRDGAPHLVGRVGPR